MTGQRDPHTQVHDEKPAGMLGDRLQLMFEWYKGMVDESTGRLLYLYDPENDVTIGDGELIRDIAAIWDVEVLSAFLGRDDLRPLIRRSLDYFTRLIVERDGYTIVASRGKQSSIAHSAFLALALSRSEFPDKIRRFAPLIDGILRQQRKDGSYKIFFDAEPDSGEELYPAEAMLSLLEAYRLTRDARYLDSVERSFAHYKRAYYDRGRVQPDFLVFFANWQSQAGRLLFEATTKPKVKDLVRAFLFELHDLVDRERLLRSRGAPAGGAGVRRGCLRARRARRCVRDRRLESGSADGGLSAMRPDGARLSHARTADDRLHRQRTGWLWRLARNSRAADRRDRPCGERIHQECRERDRRTRDVIGAFANGSPTSRPARCTCASQRTSILAFPNGPRWRTV